MAGTLRERRETLGKLRRLGGRLSLDFLNTIDPRHGQRAHDFLRDYVDFALWAADAGTVDEAAARRLTVIAAKAPRQAAVVFNRAITLRETLYRILSAALSGAPPLQEDLDQLHSELHAAFSRRVLKPERSGYRWDWNEDGCLERPVWPILGDVAELLTTPEFARMKLCPGRDCGWLFLDQSKNRSRRWCSMDICGSRDKMRRMYARQRATRSAGPPTTS